MRRASWAACRGNMRKGLRVGALVTNLCPARRPTMSFFLVAGIVAPTDTSALAWLAHHYLSHHLRGVGPRGAGHLWLSGRYKA